MHSEQSADQNFMLKLTQIVEAEMHDEHFGVTELAQKMNMSRSSLYFKVKSNTGKSVSKFICEVRLKKAMLLLKEGAQNVSEVAYEVGFASATYFNTCFHEYYGFPPGYAKEKQAPFVMDSTEPSFPEQQSSDQKTKSKSKIILVSVVFLFVLLASVFLVKVFLSPKTTVSKSIAVLPFKSLSEDPDNQYFADGVTESIMENLNIIHDLKVISRTSAERYRDNSGKTLAQIASELEVSHVLEGSVQKKGEQLRIWVKLMEVGSHENQIWSHQYDRHIRDLFAVQSEIAQQVAIALRIILTPEESFWMGAVEPTKSMEAWDLFIKATQPKKESKRDYEQANRKLKEALELDPDFGRAYCSLGGNLYKLRYFGAPQSVWRDSALTLIQQSIDINPERSQPYRYMAGIYKTIGDEEKVYACLIKGLENYPNDYIIMRDLAHHYERTGEFDKAIDFALKALSIDRPNEEEVNYYEKLGKLFLNLDWQLAERYFEKSLETGYRTHFLLKELYKFEFRKKNFKSALNYAIAMSEIAPTKYTTFEALGFGYLLTGQYAKAEENFEQAIKIRQNTMENPSPESDAYSLYMALVKIHLGKADEAKKIIAERKASALEVVAHEKDNSKARPKCKRMKETLMER